MAEQEEFFIQWRSGFYTIEGNIEGDENLVVISDGNSYDIVAKEDLIPKKESAYAKREQQVNELETFIETRRQELIDDLIDDAIEALTQRMKINAAFVKELKTLMSKNANKTIQTRKSKNE